MGALPIGLATVSNAQYSYLACCVVNAVNDAVIAHADAPAIGTAGEFGHAVWTRCVFERQQGAVDAGSDLAACAIRAQRLVAIRLRRSLPLFLG
jgi:hypothetical protein